MGNGKFLASLVILAVVAFFMVQLEEFTSISFNSLNQTPNDLSMEESKTSSTQEGKEQNKNAQIIEKTQTSSEQHLSKSHANLYEAIMDAFSQQKSQINVSLFTLDSNEVFQVREEVLQDFPEIFYFDHEGSYFWTDGKLEFQYKFSPKEISQMTVKLEEKVEVALQTAILPGMSSLEKVMALHDYVVLTTAYDYDNFVNNTVPHLSYTAYGALVNGIAVCDGYTKAMNLLLRQVGIESKYVVGEAGGNAHSWNLVKLDNEWYHMDATWNDPVPDRPGQVGYKYFLLSDRQLEMTHTWEKSAYPRATSERFAHFTKMEHGVKDGNILFFTDDNSLFRTHIDGTGLQKLVDVRAYDIAIGNQWIYFSNYSHGGYLFKVKRDGSSLTGLNSTYSKDLALTDGVLYYTDQSTQDRIGLQVND
ncbi:MAG: DUF5050 domain-containing protein [Bacillus sp. (in: Bacteria)]|nr:DUF5050 domain-containing protein [Bacillus sp. (in: firmicutes)]